MKKCMVDIDIHGACGKQCEIEFVARIKCVQVKSTSICGRITLRWRSRLTMVGKGNAIGDVTRAAVISAGPDIELLRQTRHRECLLGITSDVDQDYHH